MFRKSRRSAAGRLVSSFAMALALAGGTAVATGIAAPAAYAQDNSRGFVEAYQAVMATEEGAETNWSAVVPQLPTLTAAIENENDRFIAGQIHLQTGSNLNDPALQREGLEMMIASGMVAPENLAQYQFFVGSLAFNAGDYAAAIPALQAAVDGGHTDQDPRGLIVQSYFQQEMIAEGVAYALDQANALAGTAQGRPEAWLLRALQASYDNELVAEANAVALALVEHFPTATNFNNAVQITYSIQDHSQADQLDMLRLLRLAATLPARDYFVRYIEAADPRIMSNEVAVVLAEGVAAQEFTESDQYYLDVMNVAQPRLEQDRNDAPGLVSEAEAGSDAESAMIAGDVLYSINDFAGAELMYALAAERDAANPGLALTRLGMAQVQQGKYAEAVTTFDGVSGARENIAGLWKAYAASMVG